MKCNPLVISWNAEGGRIGHGIGGFTAGYEVAFQALLFVMTIGYILDEKCHKRDVS
jgi:hypothetical protein